MSKSTKKHADPDAESVNSPNNDLVPTMSQVQRDEEEESKRRESKTKKLSSDEIRERKSYTIEQIKEKDAIVEKAVPLFFMNQVEDCENTLKEHMAEDPINMAGYGLVGFLRYALSMEQEQSDIAMDTLESASSFASQLHPNHNSFVKGFRKLGSAFSRGSSKGHWLTPAEYRAKTIHAECQAVRVFILVLTQSITALMRAAIALNRSHKLYSELLKEREEREKVNEAKTPEEIGLDLNSIYCVDFGMGAIHMALSLLPSNVVGILKVFGMSGDRDTGFFLVRRCFDSNTLLSPFAGALLLTMYGFMPGFSRILVPSHIPMADEIAKETLSRPGLSNSLMHLWLVGRIARISRNINRSTELIHNCLESKGMEQIKNSMPQLRHIAIYDLTINACIQLDFDTALKHLAVLHEESKWSRIFYLYLSACCCEMLAHRAAVKEDRRTVAEWRKRATKYYWEAAHNKVTLLGGKVMRVDQFIAKRINEILELADVKHPNPDNKVKVTPITPYPREDLVLTNLLPLPIFESLALFSMCHQVSHAEMLAIIKPLRAQLFLEAQCCEDNETNAKLIEVAKKIEEAEQANPISEVRGEKISRDVSTSYDEELEAHVRRTNSMTKGFGRMLYLVSTIGFLLANAEDAAQRRIGATMLEVVKETPKFKDKSCSLSYLRPFAMCEYACALYEDNGKDATSHLFDKFNKEYANPHYYFHSLIDTRIQMVLSFFKKPLTLSPKPSPDIEMQDSMASEKSAPSSNDYS